MTRSRDDWTRIRFGDIAEQINDRVDDPNAAGVDRYVGLEHLDPESLRVTRWGSPDEVSAQKLRFRPGDIIFGKRRAYQRKVAVADFEGICSAHAMVLRERKDVLAPGFLIHFMASDAFMERAVQISVGSLSPTINWSTLRHQEFDLPPFAEQRRVTDLFTQIDYTIDALTNFISAVERVFRQYIDVFCGSDSRPSLPLRALCEEDRGVAVGPFGSLLHKHDYCDDRDGVAVVMPADMVNGSINHATVARVSRPKAAEMGAYSLRAGDLLLPRRGELDRRARVSEADVPALCGTGSIRLRPRDLRDSPRMFFALSASRTVRFLEDRSQGSIMPSIGAKTVAAIPVAAMSPDERDAATKHAELLETAIVQTEERLLALRKLRKRVGSFTRESV